jgi:hypothetical protein
VSIYFHEVDKGGHFAARKQPGLFAAEMRAAFTPLRLIQSRSAGPAAHECAGPTTGVEGDA